VEYLIGVDGGGTKTHGIITDIDGNIIAESITSSSNFQMLGAEPVAKLLVDLIYELVEKAKCKFSDVKLAVLGLTGAGREKDREKIYNAIILHSKNQNLQIPEIIIETDARIALEGALMGQPGIILIAGTGSVMFARDVNGEIHRVGGWGRFIGDEGSAFVIGREALRAVAKYIDGRGEETILKKMIFEKFEINDLMQIVSGIYSGEFDIAKVAPIVMEAVELGDYVAKEILDEACDELFYHIEAMTKKTNFGEKINLVLLGGVLQNENYVSKKLRNMVKEKLPNVNLLEPLASPAYGGIVYAKNFLKNKISTEK